MTLLLILILVVILIGGIPIYRGTFPLNSVLGIIIAIVLIMLLLGVLAPYHHIQL